MTNTADLYLRLSLDFEGATSIDRQEADCRRWCASHDLVVRQVHVDRGVSGFSETAHRNGFDAALAAVTAGQTDTLVAWKLDRLSRRGVGQVGQVLDQFERAGARLVSVQDQLDTAQPQARMIIALLSEFARAESETMGVRIKSAKRAQRARGLWLSGKPPFGYAIAPDHRLRPVEPAASVMREVFERLAAGNTLMSVCAFLNDSGQRNSRGGRWQISTLSTAIRSPAYAGLTPDRHVNDKGQHASGYPTVFRDADTGLEVSCLTDGAVPIVSRATQLAVFEMLERRWTRYGQTPSPRRTPYALLLRGFGMCAGCGGPLVTFNGYRCRKVNRFGDTFCTDPANAMVVTVDSRVERAWLDLISTPTPQIEPARQMVMRRWTPTTRRQPRWAKLEAELADLHVRLSDADAAHYVRGDLDAVRHADVAGKLTTRIATVRAKLADLNPHLDTTPLDDREYTERQWQATGYDGRRDLLRLTWSAVVLAKAGHRGGHFNDRRITYVPVTAPTAPYPKARP